MASPLRQFLSWPPPTGRKAYTDVWHRQWRSDRTLHLGGDQRVKVGPHLLDKLEEALRALLIDETPQGT